MSEQKSAKLDELRALFRQMQWVLVAYSGGVDSALVMLIAHQELGARALACIGRSPSYPRRELDGAVELVRRLEVPFRIINTLEHIDPNYAANSNDRCFYCKRELYTRLRQIALHEGWNVILDGSHVDDVSDHVNGIRAARQQGVRSPLLEANLSKGEIREIARGIGLPAWDKPAMACLSSRVPHGTAITPALLRQIESAEDVLASLGFRQFRVRHHGDLARIELPLNDLPRAIEHGGQIVSEIRRTGYRHVTLDLAGFRPHEIASGVPLVQITTHSVALPIP